MWTTLSILAALSLAPAQTGDLEVNNIRTTYGFLGPDRSDKEPLLPGDVLFVAFDIDNIRTDDTGKILYSLGMEVVDSKGKTVYKQDPQDLEGTNSLGGHHLPAFAKVELGLDQPPGQYTLRVSVTDRLAKKTKTFERPFEVAPRSFGLVRLGISADPEGRFPMPSLGATGQPVWIHYTAVGFERGGQKKEPDMNFKMEILDEQKNPTLRSPNAGDVKELPQNLNFCPLDSSLVLNRPGKFTVRILGTDQLSKKTSEISFPLTVIEQK
jgi:hypothetical protein